MGGRIRKLDVVRHPMLIIRGFGFRVFMRCLLAKQGETFLGILAKEHRI